MLLNRLARFRHNRYSGGDLVFVAMRILPGDPAVAALGEYATPEQLASFRERMGLNVPLWQQYLDFLVNIVTLNFGTSMITGENISAMLWPIFLTRSN